MKGTFVQLLMHSTRNVEAFIEAFFPSFSLYFLFAALIASSKNLVMASLLSFLFCVYVLRTFCWSVSSLWSR